MDQLASQRLITIRIHQKLIWLKMNKSNEIKRISSAGVSSSGGKYSSLQVDNYVRNQALGINLMKHDATTQLQRICYTMLNLITMYETVLIIFIYTVLQTSSFSCNLRPKHDTPQLVQAKHICKVKIDLRCHSRKNANLFHASSEW